MSDKPNAEKYHNILDLNFFPERLTAESLLEIEPVDLVSYVQCNYLPRNGFFDQFES
jgi:hypothetical protein